MTDATTTLTFSATSILRALLRGDSYPADQTFAGDADTFGGLSEHARVVKIDDETDAIIDITPEGTLIGQVFGGDFGGLTHTIDFTTGRITTEDAF